MVKRRFDSITVTIVLTVIVAVVLGFNLQRLVTFGMVHLGFEMQQQLPRPEQQVLLQLPGRVATLLDTLDATPVTNRPAVVAASQIPQVQLQLLDAPAPNLANIAQPNIALLRWRIQATLTSPRPLIVADADPISGPASGRLAHGVSIEAALTNGQWLLISSNLDPPPPVDPVAAEFLQVRFASWLILSIVLGVLLAMLAARRVVKPLSELATAVDQLGSSGDNLPIPLRGPREVEGAIMAFNRLQERLRRFNDDRTRMMGAMSHDLRTPLTRLRIRIEMVQALEDQQKMLDEVDMMSGMVESILSFARDDAKKEPRSLVDLTALVEGICQDAADAGEKVTFSGPRGVTISCRPTAMRRAVSNLVDNAVKYGGKADVTLAPEAGRLAILVEDEGPGISRSEREKVFEPFYRSGNARDPSTGGVGLGLSVTRSIVWEHGGNIDLSARRGGGLAVRIELPIGMDGRGGARTAEPGAQTGSH